MKRKLAAIFTATIMAASIIGCGTSSSTSTTGGDSTVEPSAAATEAVSTDTEAASSNASAATDGKIRVVAGAQAEIGDMNPYYTTGCKTAWQQCIYESLGTRDGLGGDLSLVLAKSYNMVDDLNYDIEIYDNIYDSNGNHITADDIAFDYQWMKDSGTVSKMGNLDSMKATGDYTLHMTLTKATVGVFEDMMTRNIVSKAEYEANGEDMTKVTVGTGPYICDELISGSSITLTKRDDYWQTDESCITPSQVANVDEFTIKYISSTSQLAIALQTGEIDGILYMSGSDSSYFVNDDNTAVDGYFVNSWMNPNTYQLFANMDSASALADNKDLREGIFRAIDPDAIITGVLANRGQATHDYANQVYPEYNTEWDSEDYYNYDLDAAKKYIASSGYNGEEIKLVTYNMSPYKEMAEVLQAYWQQAGLNVSITPIEQTQRDTIFASVDDWDLFLITTLSPDSIVNCYTYLLDANNWDGATITHYADDKFQSLLETACQVSTYSQDAVNDFHDYMVETAIARGIVSETFYSIWHEGVNELYYQRNGYPMLTASSFDDNWTSVANK